MFAVRPIWNPEKLIALATMGISVHDHETNLTIPEGNNIVNQILRHGLEYGKSSKCRRMCRLFTTLQSEPLNNIRWINHRQDKQCTSGMGVYHMIEYCRRLLYMETCWQNSTPDRIGCKASEIYLSSPLNLYSLAFSRLCPGTPNTSNFTKSK